jgi:hypothetical protein
MTTRRQQPILNRHGHLPQCTPPNTYANIIYDKYILPIVSRCCSTAIVCPSSSVETQAPKYVRACEYARRLTPEEIDREPTKPKGAGYGSATSLLYVSVVFLFFTITDQIVYIFGVAIVDIWKWRRTYHGYGISGFLRMRVTLSFSMPIAPLILPQFINSILPASITIQPHLTMFLYAHSHRKTSVELIITDRTSDHI